MTKFTIGVKISLAATLISLLAYTCYIIRGTYIILFGYFANVSSDVAYVSFVGPSFWAGYVGINARLIGLIVGLTIIFLLWNKSWAFSRVKKLVAAALILESVNFLGLAPSVWLLLNPKNIIFVPSLGIGYLLQILFTVPFLWALAYQVAKYRDVGQRASILNFGALAFVGYIVTLVANEVSRWASMVSLQSLRFIEGIRAVGFFNALAFMPFAIVFAVIGAYRLLRKNENSAMKWFGVSLSIVGLNYIIYLAYAYTVNVLNTLPLVDIWTIPLLSLGIALFLNSQKASIN